MRIQHNIMAMNAYRNLGMNNKSMNKNLEKLSSGYRINRAGDDAAGLAISEKMRAQISGLDQAQKNAQSGINLIQTAEGALTEVHDMLNRMVTLSTQAANGTYGETERDKIQAEIDSLTEEINRIAENSNFNGKKLLDGTLGGGAVDAATAPAVGTAVGTDVNADLAEIGELTFADGVTDEQKAALNEALIENGLTFTLSETADAGDTVAAPSLDGYTVKMYEGDGTSEATATGNLASIAIEDDEGNVLATMDVAIASSTGLANGDFEITFEAGEVEEETPAATGDYTVAIEGDDGVNALTAGGAITIDGKEYDLGSGGTIDTDTLTTFAEQMATAVELYNQENDTNYTVEYADGVLTFTKKDDAAEDAAAPGTTSINDTNGLITAGEVTEVEKDDTAAGPGLQLQIGADGGETITVQIGSMKADALGIDKLDVSDEKKANAAIKIINDAIEKVSVQRSNLGAYQNRLEHTINNLGVMEENIQDAEANIRDTDIADEMMAYTKNNILIQSAQAMLAQANQVPQGVLQLMG